MMRHLRCALAVSFLGGLGLPALAAAQERCLLIEAGDGNSPIVMARVKGDGPFAFVLDTASSGTTLDERTISRLGLVRDAETEEAQGLGGAFSVRLFKSPSIMAGPVSLSDTTVPEVPAPQFESHDVVGLAGVDLVAERLTVWRPGTGCVGFMASGGHPEGEGWVEIEVEWLQAWKILVPVRIGDVSGFALLDTGAQHSVMNGTFASALNLTEVSSRLRPAGEMTGLDGRPQSLLEADIADVVIGPWKWATTTVNIGELAVFSRLGDPRRPLMVLGMDWLAGRPFAIDYGARKVWLRETPVTQRTVALTFDDLPYAGAIGKGENALSPAEVVALNARVREILARHGAPAAGFVVEQAARAMGDQADAALSPWAQGDLVLANHSYSHADTNALDLAGVEQEIVRGEAIIRPLMEAAERPLRFMRFPMNHTGDTPEKRAGIQALLERLGYEAAASTIDTSDYLFEQAYRRALGRDDPRCAARIRDAYLRHSAEQIDYYAALNTGVVGYAPPEIALLHLNGLNADVLEDLLALYVARGYRFISLEDAQRDPVYRTPPAFASPHGPMWGYRWARERRIQVNGAREPSPPDWIVTVGAGGECALQDPEESRGEGGAE